jgi:Zn-dependent peptidase ImmA (M78 family)
MIGERLKLARTSAGLSLRGLAERLGNLVSAQALGKYERGEMVPSSTVLMALADALAVPESYLVSSGRLQLEGVEFRKLKIAGAKEQATLQAQVIRHAERYLQVEDLLAADSIEWRFPANFPYSVTSADQAELAADKLRLVWQLGEDPIPQLAEYLEERGIKVLLLDLAESISGMAATVRRSSRRAIDVIVINRQHPGERQRFTLAHELGHLLLREAGGIDKEAACNRFAGAFLAPAAALRPEVGPKRHNVSFGELLRLKQLFLVSISCLIYRLKDLEVISPAIASQMFAAMNRLHIRKKEPGELRSEETQRFERLCFRAFTEGVISASKAAELLDVTVRRLDELLEVRTGA